jgi:two-component system LytT family response regulator
MIRCMIVDDKPLAIDILKEYICRVPGLQLDHETRHPLEALDYFQSAAIDLIFLDIQMPELDGLEFLRILQGRALVILSTAYAKYALAGYDYGVVDYLLKPVSFERFLQAVGKARQALLVRESPASSTENARLPAANALFIKTGYRIERVPFEEILYIESRQNYVALITGSRTIMSLQNLKQIEEKLPAGKFIRVHKSYLVSVDQIRTIEKGQIHIGKAVIPVGDNYREAFFSLLDKGT